MDLKKITAFAAAFMLSVNLTAALPELGGIFENAYTVSAASSKDDFVIKTDSEGKKYVLINDYTGKGGNIKIPDGVEYIGSPGFWEGNENKNITGITVPKSCTKLEYQALRDIDTLKYIIFEGDVAIDGEAFAGCYALEKVTVKGSIIDYISGFDGCYSLKTVKISKSKYDFRIADFAFADCVSLTSINIPSKCTNIGWRAFCNCSNLKSMTIPAKTKLEKESIGYANLSFKKPETEKGAFGWDLETFVADGKKSGYHMLDSVYEWEIITPKRLTVTVVKSSPAEKYCKENGIKYKYAKTTKK